MTSQVANGTFPPETATDTIVLECNRLNSVEIETLGETDEQRAIWTNSLGSGIQVYPDDEISVHSAYVNQQGGGTDAIEFNGKQFTRSVNNADGTRTTTLTQDNKQSLDFSFYRCAEGTNYAFLPVPMTTDARLLSNVANYYDAPQCWTKQTAGYLPTEENFVTDGSINGAFQHDASRYTHMDIYSNYTPANKQIQFTANRNNNLYNSDYNELQTINFNADPDSQYMLGGNYYYLGGGIPQSQMRTYNVQTAIKTNTINLELPTGFISAEDVATSLTNQLQGLTSLNVGRLSKGAYYTGQLNGDANALALVNNVYQELDAIVEPVPLIKRDGGLDGTDTDPTTTTANQTYPGTPNQSVFNTYYVANRGNTMLDADNVGLLDSNKYFESILFKNPDLITNGQGLAKTSLYSGTNDGNSYLPILTPTSVVNANDPPDIHRTAMPFNFVRCAYIGDGETTNDLLPTCMVSQRLAYLHKKDTDPTATTKSDTYIVTNAKWTYQNLLLFKAFFDSQSPSKDNFTNVASVVFDNATNEPLYEYGTQYSSNEYRFINVQNVFDSINAAGFGGAGDTLYEEASPYTTPSPFLLAGQSVIPLGGRFGADKSVNNNIGVLNTNVLKVADTTPELIGQRTAGQTHLQFISFDESRANIISNAAAETGLESWGGFAYRRSPERIVAGITGDADDYIALKIPSNVAFLNGEINVNLNNLIGIVTSPVGDYWDVDVTPTYDAFSNATPFAGTTYPASHFPCLFTMGVTDSASIGGVGRYAYWNAIDATIPEVLTNTCVPYSYIGWSPTYTSYGNEAMILTSGYTESVEHNSLQTGGDDVTFGGDTFTGKVHTSWNNQKIDKCLIGAKSMAIQYDNSVDGSIGRFSFTELHTAPESGNYWSTGDPYPQDWTASWGDADNAAGQLIRAPKHHDPFNPGEHNKQLATQYADWWFGTEKSYQVTDAVLNGSTAEVFKTNGFHSMGAIGHEMPIYTANNTTNRPYGIGTSNDPTSMDAHSYPYFCGRSRTDDGTNITWNGNGVNMPNVVSKISNAGNKVLRINPNYYENNGNENYNMMVANNINPKTGVMIDATCGIFIEDFNITNVDYQNSMWSKLGFTYSQLHPTKGSRQGNTPNVTAGFQYTDNAVLPLTTGADISQISQGNIVCGRFGYSQGLTTMVGRVYDNLEHLANFVKPISTGGATPHLTPVGDSENYGRYNSFANAQIGRQIKKDYTNFDVSATLPNGDTPWGVKGSKYLSYTDGGSGFATWNISNNQTDGLQFKQTSSMIQSFKIKKSQDFPYLTIFTDLITGQEYRGGGGVASQLPAIAVVPKQNASDDFFYNTYDNTLTFKATKPYELSQITTKIARPDGRLANVDRGSSVIYLIKRARRLHPPNLAPEYEQAERELAIQQTEQEEKEELSRQKYLSSLSPQQRQALEIMDAEGMSLDDMENFLLTANAQ